jgi:hypothetical protein
MCIPHDEYARQGYTAFKRRVSKVGRCPCSDLIHGYRFYSVRHGYLWVATDQGPGGSVKWTQPARSSADLQVGLKNLSTVPTTLEDVTPQVFNYRH